MAGCLFPKEGLDYSFTRWHCSEKVILTTNSEGAGDYVSGMISEQCRGQLCVKRTQMNAVKLVTLVTRRSVASEYGVRKGTRQDLFPSSLAWVCTYVYFEGDEPSFWRLSLEAWTSKSVSHQIK